jgi:hypothetical protein
MRQRRHDEGAMTDIPIRDMRFRLDDVPRHWHGGRKALTNFFDNLSLFFPRGELFFITSVDAHKHVVEDPKLSAAVRAFCSQEGFHRREHVAYNEMLQAQGYPTADIDARVKRVLDRARRILSPRRQLAVTCALEHFTALLAEGTLGDDAVLAGAHPELAALWRWHAVEENEHKSVAFDVYQAAGGGYLERCLIMVHVTFVFWLLVWRHQVQMMRADGIASSAREWRDLLTFLYVHPGGLRKIVGPYFRYFAPNFHPQQIPESEGLRAWRERISAAYAQARRTGGPGANEPESIAPATSPLHHQNPDDLGAVA